MSILVVIKEGHFFFEFAIFLILEMDLLFKFITHIT